VINGRKVKESSSEVTYWENNEAQNSKTAKNISDYARFEVLLEVETELTLKNAVFWDVMLCGSCKNRRFGGTYRLHRQGDKNRLVINNDSSN
jgi:hypothetical protein